MNVDYATMIARYREDSLPEDEEWFTHYRNLSLADAIADAALARGPNGEKFSHQRRIPLAVLALAKRALLAQQRAIGSCNSFDELHRLVEDAAGSIPGFGELATYDTSVRLGAHLDLWPDKVYLHAGTKDGYGALGGDPSARYASVKVLPPELLALPPHQVEDLLCIYKDELAGKVRRTDPNYCLRRGKVRSC